jgi:anaerobic magnesium-protoporphyrin IX monomethyl ester cyclase
MKIIYLNGPYRKLSYSRSSRSPAVTKSGTIYYPLWLAYAAGLARRRTEFQIELLDTVARKWDRPDLIDYLKNSPPDLVFCDTSTPSISEDIATASALKHEFPQTRLVMVGTHATALPEEVLNAEKNLDAVIRGEFDLTAIELAQAMAQGNNWETVDGISLRRDDTIVHTRDRELIGDLDQFPFVSEVYRDFLRVEDYFFAAAQFPMVMTVTSRGCPHRCDWCLYPQVMHRGRYRMRSSENVAAEFAYLTAEMPHVREVGIEDDLFTGNKKRLREICNLLIAQNNKLNFWCDTRVDLDYETMRLMKAAGCRLLIAGFESASQTILDTINKGTEVDKAHEFMTHARRADLLVHGCFVVGNPGETPATMQATLDFAKKLNPDSAQFFPMIVYPGTRMYHWAKENGYLRRENYNDWLTEDGLHNSIVDLPGLRADEIRNFCDFARRQFYLRRGYVFKKIAQSLTDLHEARRNVKAFRRFARFLVKTS